ncbi:MAG: preprotein translocase subunit YajC [Bifidobacteriaceae bacterium]|jgi:preprotein translocase subunit YajC|nr:preprotein translocase subunit YajC [Bifidobacteriaceae bacterium]
MIAGVIALFWFSSRRQRKQQQQQADFRSGLEVGQRVVTVGGMIGVIGAIEGDVVTLVSPAGDESLYVRRAVKSQVSDDEWMTMVEPYPPEDEEDPGVSTPSDAADSAEFEDAQDEPDLDEPKN